MCGDAKNSCIILIDSCIIILKGVRGLTVGGVSKEDGDACLNTGIILVLYHVKQFFKMHHHCILMQEEEDACLSFLGDGGGGPG